MRAVGDAHPEPAIRDEYYAQAAAFERSDKAGKNKIVHELGRGFAVLLVTPLALAGAALVAAGAVLYGTGKVVAGLGNLLTRGAMNRDQDSKASARSVNRFLSLAYSGADEIFIG